MKPTAPLFGLDEYRVWDTETAFELLRSAGQAETKRTAERKLSALGLWPSLLDETGLVDELARPANSMLVAWSMERARSKRALVLFAQIHISREYTDTVFLHANDARGGRYWIPIKGEIKTATLLSEIKALQSYFEKPITIYPSGQLLGLLRGSTMPEGVTFPENVYAPKLDISPPSKQSHASSSHPLTPHLRRLEAESIHIIREAVAEAENPVMMYSVGKDSSVMLHLARKAFYPSPPPFPLLHVDTRWKFQEMYLFRDHMAQVSGMDLLVHINPESIARDINPFDHGSALHTDITKTEGLKQALDHYKFDVIFGGARRDEEKSRAKERIFSFRTATHRWDPKQQRPELWNLYNTKKNLGESIRVFPLSNWTELDIWQYIYHENIPVVPLYFAKPRPVVVRNGLILMVDDNRFRLLPGEQIQEKMVRFRTLGCYPLTGAVESTASNLPEIILELVNARSSERQGRAIDSDTNASMEKKKQEGYF